MPLDLLSEGHLQRFSEYRASMPLKLYLCKHCVRSFEGDDEQAACKFCFGSEITELGQERRCCSRCKTFFHGQNDTCPECSKLVFPIFTIPKLRKREGQRATRHVTKHRIREKLPDVAIKIPYPERSEK